jgi:hypothetical protein
VEGKGERESRPGGLGNSIAANKKYRPEATLLWRDQLALEPGHYRFGLHGVSELHRRLQLMRATMTFKGPKVIT